MMCGNKVMCELMSLFTTEKKDACTDLNISAFLTLRVTTPIDLNVMNQQGQWVWL